MTNTTATIKVWAATGRTFTSARNAGIMRLLTTGVKQSEIATETGVDKSDVSKLAKFEKALTDNQRKSLKRLSWPVEGSETDLEAVASWAKFGAEYGTRKKDTSAGRVVNETSPLDKFNAAVATVVALLAANPDEEAAWSAFLMDSITPEAIAAERIVPEEETEEVAA